MSYQDYEYTVSSEYAIRVCNEFAKYTATGVTFITGSGSSSPPPLLPLLFSFLLSLFILFFYFLFYSMFICLFIYLFIYLMI